MPYIVTILFIGLAWLAAHLIHKRRKQNYKAAFEMHLKILIWTAQAKDRFDMQMVRNHIEDWQKEFKYTFNRAEYRALLDAMQTAVRSKNIKKEKSA